MRKQLYSGSGRLLWLVAWSPPNHHWPNWIYWLELGTVTNYAKLNLPYIYFWRAKITDSIATTLCVCFILMTNPEKKAAAVPQFNWTCVWWTGAINQHAEKRARWSGTKIIVINPKPQIDDLIFPDETFPNFSSLAGAQITVWAYYIQTRSIWYINERSYERLGKEAKTNKRSGSLVCFLLPPPIFGGREWDVGWKKDAEDTRDQKRRLLVAVATLLLKLSANHISVCSS